MIDHDLYIPRSRPDADAALAIADRAARMDPSLDRTAVSMDVITVHNVVGLKLDDMLSADDLNFAHDVFGIRRHLDRETGQLKDHFLPRFAQ